MQDWLKITEPVTASAGGLLALALATFISEDLACIGAGLLVTEGTLTSGPAVGACFTGIFAGDMLLVLLGRTVGRRSLRAAPLRWCVSVEAVERAERWFERRGPGLILASRFMPGTRLPTYVAAGVLRAPLARFTGWFVLACALWTPLLVGAAVLFGGATRRLFESWANFWPAVLFGGAVALIISRLAVNLSTWRGRRLLLGKWRRLARWEFWPMWAIYPPIVVYIFWLGLRHRSFTLFTAVNPGIGAGGGLAGESKSEILRGLAGAGDAIARWSLIPAGSTPERESAFEQFLREQKISFPVVLKPDVGERGAGVVIARNRNQVRDAFDRNPAPFIAQAYVPGIEFGVFYVRRPSAARGDIFAITDKRMTTVAGDGVRTLEELILADDRAVCSAPLFLKTFASRLDEIPAHGEIVALSELGTHCRGALFLDGTHLATPELVRAVENVSRSFVGFYFGRYDVRAASLAAFQRGEFTVIELNGLTSEATSIYDPRHSVWFGWRTLARQWRLAFSIAAENRIRGTEPLTFSEIYRVLAAHTRTP